jgi:hypothetical protein
VSKSTGFVELDELSLSLPLILQQAIMEALGRRLSMATRGTGLNHGSPISPLDLPIVGFADGRIDGGC